MSVVAAVTAVEGAPVNFTSLLTVVPVTPAFATSMTTALAVPRSRLPPRAPEIVGVVRVGPVARTIKPLPLVPFERSLAAACVPELTRPWALVVTLVYVPAEPTA